MILFMENTNSSSLFFIVISILSFAACASPGPIPRPAPIDQGSARWGYKIAQPLLTAFAPDVQLYTILGTAVHRDGRLPSNTGTWSYVGWSPNLKQVVQIDVRYDASTLKSTYAANSAPSQDGNPIPGGWLDSTDIFAIAAPHLTCGVSEVNLTVLNVTSFPQAPGQPVWGISFDVGQNQLIKWDGTYIGTQGKPDVPCAANLASSFLSTDACANMVFSGVSYDMNDPLWIINQSNQNRDTCAYKFFSALHMLGYQTEDGQFAGATNPQTLGTEKFQKNSGLTVSSVVDAKVIKSLDSSLVPREAKIAPIASTFPLYSHMEPLHPHQVSRNWLAYLYTLPMNVLPQSLHMSPEETFQCIKGQCVGFIQDFNGNDLGNQAGLTINSNNYYFVGAYFDPRRLDPWLPSSTVTVQTLLHEFGHYIDGRGSPDPNFPVRASVPTNGYYNISYDMSQLTQGQCAPKRSQNLTDWLTYYGFLGTAKCPQGTSDIVESWAEDFSLYVTDGKAFRAAALQSNLISQKYSWLKANVFQGTEYDTDLPGAYSSGCNDVPGTQGRQPGWISCDENYVWDGELRTK